MAVEATHTHLSPFAPQMTVHSRELMGQQMLFPDIPPSAALLPRNNPSSDAAKTSINTDSGLGYTTSNNYYIRPVSPRKRTVDQILYPADVSLFHQHHLDIDTIITQHTKKIKLELREMQKQETKLLIAAIGRGAMRRLKEKEDQIQRISKLNFVLQHKLKSLCVENQLWRNLAQTNEATANSLRVSIEQALARVGNELHGAGESDDDYVESCCGSSDHEINDQDKGVGGACYSDRRCRMCGERESCVLMLPCRHLCLCDVCGSGSRQIQACPVCNSSMKATLHVNMSMP